MTIAGIGVVSGYGWGRAALWRGLLSGKSAARLLPGYGAGRDEYAWVATVPDDGGVAAGSSRYGRAVQAAAREAVEDARARGWRPGRAVGVLHSIVLGDVRNWRDFYVADQGHRPTRGFLPLLDSTVRSVLAQEFGFHGPSMGVSAACSSANVALLTAQMWLAQGLADDVLCVNTDLSATPDMLEHMVKMGAAVADAEPLDACRPFQQGSRGFSMGEASVGFVLGRAERPYARMLGGAMSNDGYHVVSVDPSHEQIFDCVRRALDVSGVRPDQVRYYNAHGPGTRQCDAAETQVLTRIFDDRPEVYSIKPLTGHCQGASGGVEIAAAALGYESRIVPAAPIVAPAHPRLLDGPVACAGGITVKTSLGMGGHNSVIVLESA